MFSKAKQLISRHKRLFIVLGLIIIAGLIYYFFFAKQESYDEHTVAVGAITQTISASGTVSAHEMSEAKFITPSKVTWVGVEKGDVVTQWQTLASLDKRQLQKHLETKMLTYMTTRWDHEQLSDDLEVNGRDINTLDLTDEEKRALEKSQFGLDQSVLAVEIQDLVNKEAYLSAPIAGTVVSTGDMRVGENLTGADLESKYFTIVDLDTLYFLAEVDELDYYMLEVGQNAKVSIDAYPDDIFDGVITFINKTGSTTSGGSTAIFVEIDLGNYPDNLITDLNGEADIVVQRKDSIIIVPKKYVDGDIVLILTDGKTVERQVETGISDESNIEITSGLDIGEIIVIPADET